MNANESNVFDIKKSFTINTVIKDIDAIQEECTSIKKEIDETIPNFESPTQYKIKCDGNTIISITEQEAIEKFVKLRKSKDPHFLNYLLTLITRKCNNFIRSDFWN